AGAQAQVPMLEMQMRPVQFLHSRDDRGIRGLPERGLTTRRPEVKPLCIYHGGCDDGFAAAWVVRKALGGEVDFYPGVYQKDPPAHDGRDVIFVDFSYKRPVLEAMAQQAASVLILDHHKTAAEDLCDLPQPPDFGAWAESRHNLSLNGRLQALFD